MKIASMGNMIMLAPAKVNLFLEAHTEKIGLKHRVDTILQTVSLYDTMKFSFNLTLDMSNPKIEIIYNNDGDIKNFDCPIEENLIYKAIIKAAELTGKTRNEDIRVEITKNIPTKAGLGGGSSECATTLKALSRRWGLNPKGNDLLSVAKELGSDVPFFFEISAALMTGTGDMVVRQLPKKDMHIVLSSPSDIDGVSTADIYRKFDELNGRTLSEAALSVEEFAQMLERDAHIEDISKGVFNNFEDIVFALYPQIRKLKNELESTHGVLKAALCGSGSTVFGICEDEPSAISAAELLISKGCWAKAVNTV